MELGSHYQQTLDQLSESLRQDRRRRFTELLQQTDTQAFIPKPTPSPEAVVLSQV